jgi:hypothetical protein
MAPPHDPFGGPTRPVVMRPPTDGATTTIAVPGQNPERAAPGDATPEGATVSIVVPPVDAGPAATPAVEDDPPEDEKDA